VSIVASFEVSPIPGKSIPELTDDELKELGVSLGHRKEIQKAVRQTLDQRAASLGPTGAAAS